MTGSSLERAIALIRYRDVVYFEVWPDERWMPIAYPEDDAETVVLPLEVRPPMRPASWPVNPGGTRP